MRIKNEIRIKGDEMTGINAYIAIYIIKTIGGGLANYRLILMKEGNTLVAAIVTVLSSLTWILAMGLVMTNINEDYFIILPFVAAVVTGNYIGIFINNKIKTGSILTTLITNEKNDHILKELGESGFEVHSVSGEGKDEKRRVIFIKSSKKEHSKVINQIKEKNFKEFVINERIEEEF